VCFAAITLCVASQRAFIIVSVYFVIDSVLKLLDTPSYTSRAKSSKELMIYRRSLVQSFQILRSLDNRLHFLKMFPDSSLHASKIRVFSS